MRRWAQILLRPEDVTPAGNVRLSLIETNALNGNPSIYLSQSDLMAQYRVYTNQRVQNGSGYRLAELDSVESARALSNILNTRLLFSGKSAAPATGYNILKVANSEPPKFVQAGPKIYGGVLGLLELNFIDCVDHASGKVMER